MDIGVSSHQLDEPDRGFSYQHDAPLDMRMNREQTLSAYQLVNELSEKDLSKIIYDYGEERWAARIAQFIIDRRKNSPIKTTGELVEIIKAAIPAKARQDGSHPAKRTFQALRIAVNEELTVLEEGIHQAIECLLPGGRLVVITFHSLEDRIVKNIFKEKSQDCVCPPSFPVCTCEHEAKIKIVTKRPVTASQTELEENHRSRSAKLRAVERLSKGVKK